MPRKKIDLPMESDSQLNLLSIEEKTAFSYHENIIEKGLETFIEVGQSLQYIRDNRLYRAEYKTFANYCEQKWDFSARQAQRLMSSSKIINLLEENTTPGSQLPTLEKQARPLAKLKDDPELMAQVWSEALAEAKLQYETGLKKSAQPSHKDVDAKVKEYEAKIQTLEKDLTDAKQGELEFQQKLDEKIKEVHDLEASLANQNKQIKELNSDISIKENALKSLESQRAELDLQQQELNKLIAKEADLMAQETLSNERKSLDRKESELKAKETELEKQLKEAKAIKNKATKEKDNLTSVSDWILALNDFNEVLKQQKGHVMGTLRKIQEVPNLDVLEDSDKEIVNKKIDSVISDFHDNTEAFGMALNKVHFAIRKFDNTVLKTLGAVRGKTIEVEVLNDE